MGEEYSKPMEQPKRRPGTEEGSRAPSWHLETERRGLRKEQGQHVTQGLQARERILDFILQTMEASQSLQAGSMEWGGLFKDRLIREQTRGKGAREGHKETR